jgi:thiosulfate dehydrogenase
MNAQRTLARFFCCSLLWGCGASEPEKSAVERGKELFSSKALSASRLNDYTCQSCHDAEASVPPSKKPGAALAGVTQRPAYWGGHELDLLRAVDACRNYFMVDSEPMTDAQARDLYAYLESLEPGDETQQPFTVVTDIELLPLGDELNGNRLYVSTCSTCHGAMHTGRGRLSDTVPILPEDTLVEHAGYSLRNQRLVFTEKIRHGLFLGYGGTMPPLATERLSDAEVSDVLQALGILGDPNQQ